MHRETGRKWAPRSCILFYCQRAQQSLVVVYYHSLATHDYASWLLNTGSSTTTTLLLRRNTILIQIADCWTAAGARETGNESQLKAIFIDGLDECNGGDAQAGINDIIASSMRRSTSSSFLIQTGQHRFCHSICRTTHLSRGRRRDWNVSSWWIQEYLEQRDFPQLLPSWPTDNDIRMLIDVANGLFAHPIAVLRHVAYPQDSQYRERPQSVPDTLSNPGKHGSTSPFLLFYLFSWNVVISTLPCFTVCLRTSVTI